METTLGPTDNFVDVGAHIGFYSLMASKNIDKGKIVSVEAAPKTYSRLKNHLESNGIKNAEVIHRGVSDKQEKLELNLNLTGNTGGQGFVKVADKKSETVTVDCSPLIEIIKSSGLSSIKIMKLDIEGFEFKVLKHYFAHAESTLFPEFIITEYGDSRATGDHIELLMQIGYRKISQTGMNYVLAK